MHGHKYNFLVFVSLFVLFKGWNILINYRKVGSVVLISLNC
jgi:hypothetical protein